MKHKLLNKSSFVTLVFVILFINNGTAFSQQIKKSSEPLVVLTALTSPQGDTVAGTLASTLTSSIELMLKLTGKVTLKRADFLSPTTSLKRTIPYYDEHRATEAVYGSIALTGNDKYAVGLDIWTASNSNGRPIVLKRTISNVLSSFNLADEMSLRVASTIVGKKLEEGTLIVQNVSSLPKFSIYANGHLLGRDRTSFHILTGNWQIIVAKPGELGDVPVDTFLINIRSGETAVVALPQAQPPHGVAINNAAAAQEERPALPRAKGASSENVPPRALTVSPPTGSISIKTATGGTLYLDGRKLGHVPLGDTKLTSVSVGIRTLTIRFADGHVTRKEVTVVAGGTTRATFRYPMIPGYRWMKHALPSTQNWSSVAYGNGTFVALTSGSNIDATSIDGVNWIVGFLPSSQDWQSLTYGNGTFVAIANGPYGSDVVATSRDGVNWTQHSLPDSQSWESVTYGHGLFVAIAAAGTDAATSNNGVNWTLHSLPSNQDWQSVSYGNSTFVAIASYSSAVATSSNGADWTQSNLPNNHYWISMTYGNGIFLAVAWNNSVCASSPNGTKWTEHTLPRSQHWQSVSYGDGTFVAVASHSSILATSKDGVSWTEHTLPSTQAWRSVTYGNGTFVAVASYSNVDATSS